MRSRSFPFRCGWVLVVLASLLLCKSQGQEPKRPRGEKYALLVGVRTYDPNELRRLPYSEADVTALAAVLRGNGYKPDNVVLMTQTAGAGNLRFLPLADRIRKELSLLIGDCTEDDSILVAFAGHGVQFRGDLEIYFCPADAKLDDKSTLIALGAIYKALEKCPAGFKLLMVDACRNDPRSDNSRSLSRIQLESVTRPQQTPPPGGVMAFFSCSEGELAFEHPDLKHGVFFYYVIEGLSGNATVVGSDGVTLPELEFYVKKQVGDFVRTNYGTRQMPELMGDSRGLVPIVTLERAMLAYKRAKALKDRGQSEEARTAYDEALRLNPELARAYLDRGTLRANSGDHLGAVDDFNAATRRGLNEAWVYAWRGSSYEKTYQYDRALADYDEAIRLDPKFAFAYNSRGNVYDARRDYARAWPTTTRRSGSTPNTLSPTTAGGRLLHQTRLRPRPGRLHRGDPARPQIRHGLQPTGERLRRPTRLRPRPGRLRRGNPARPQVRHRLQRPGDTIHQKRLRPRPGRLHRGDPARPQIGRRLRQPGERLGTVKK